VTRLVLVRHGEAAAGFAADADPGLSAAGQQQARAVAERLAADLEPAPILVSPLRRCRQTAAPLEERWGLRALVDPAVGEVESPTSDLAGRGTWLRTFMQSSWDEADAALAAWRESVVQRLLQIENDTVVVSHFIAINAAVGAAMGDGRVVCFRPDNCSRTVLDVRDGALHVVELGGEAVTVVR
jgi:broad specificity phosphatase PhoE